MPVNLRLNFIFDTIIVSFESWRNKSI